MTSRYRLSFTTGGLLLSEMTAIAPILIRSGRDREATLAQCLEERVTQQRTESSRRRIAREATDRLLELSGLQLTIMADGTASERKAVAWIAACRLYSFVGEFAREVLRDHYQLMMHRISKDDFDRFSRAKADWHPELAELMPSTHAKLRQNLLRMAREADILDASNDVQPISFPKSVLETLLPGRVQDLEFFPLTNAEIEESSRE